VDKLAECPCKPIRLLELLAVTLLLAGVGQAALPLVLVAQEHKVVAEVAAESMLQVVLPEALALLYLNIDRRVI